MDALQAELTIANQERDAMEALRLTAVGARGTAEATAAQALVDLATANTAAAVANAAVLAAALSPALASTKLLDYKSGEGIKIHGKATSPLDALFNGDSGARLFLSKVQQCAIQFGWMDILKIKQGGTATAPVTYNFMMESYGQVTIASIRTQVAAWEAANDRNAQNLSQMYTFLITSIDNGLLGKVISQREHYTSATGL
jgi:hypothetical protein